jgi:oxygen-independent coproporphyrinogen-3 oxidase
VSLNQTAQPLAAYVHVPFCVSKCHYCDFNSRAGLDDLFEPYVRAVVREIDRASISHPLDTVYVGGGTPTILPASRLLAILSRIPLAVGAEVTVEANPGTVDEESLRELRDGGFNRISIGVQSFDDAFLNQIGRTHTAAQALEAYESARSAGFENVGLDLIFALPGQTLQHWETAVNEAVELGPEHISTYELTIEEGTRFGEMCAAGELDLPSEEDQLAMYELVIARLSRAGYEHYEVSNFALPGFRGRHNLTYWRNQPYFGFGAGSTSYVNGVRARRISGVETYIDEIQAGRDAIEFTERLTGRALVAETIIQGLRLLDGIDLNDFLRRTGCSLTDQFADEIERLSRRGLVAVAGSRLTLTHQGLLLLNDVSSEFAISA